MISVYLLLDRFYAGLQKMSNLFYDNEVRICRCFPHSGCGRPLTIPTRTLHVRRCAVIQ